MTKLVFVLELTEGCYYVNNSSNLNKKLEACFDGSSGSKWLKLHKPLSVYSVCFGGRHKENFVTRRLQRKFGDDKVRCEHWWDLD